MVAIHSRRKTSKKAGATCTRERMLHTRPPLDRMQQIFSLIKSGESPNRHQLAAEIEVTVKTIQRDIDFMRDRLRLPISFDQSLGGYTFTEPVSSFPLMELTEAELVSVFVAQKALAQYKGTPFEAPLRSAYDKLSSSLNNRMSVSWSDLDAMVSFRTFEVTQGGLETFQVVAEAVRRSIEVAFEYRKLDARRFENRRVRPYHLACIHDQWYLIGHCLKRRAIRTFLLARMRKPSPTGVGFVRPADFTIEGFLKNSFGVFNADGDHPVRLQFDRFGSQLVRERIWHPSQTIQEKKGGGLELAMRISSLTEIESWILSWGEHVRVIAPPELRTCIGRRLRAAVAASTQTRPKE
jgi:predicted DNA-binding transcriptional regulator YafY